MPRLSVNIDHVATVREARGTHYPEPVAAAQIVELAGAHGITIHRREDQRHIRDRDVTLIQDSISIPFTLEMALTDEMVGIALERRPNLITAVPEKREELTTEGGLDIIDKRGHVENALNRLHAAGLVVSLFLEPEPNILETAAGLGARYVELHTGLYSLAETPEAWQREFDRVRRAVDRGVELGLRMNVGHGLHYGNTTPLAALPGIDTFHTGHAIIARAVLVGLDRAVRDMIRLCRGPEGSGT